jgi:predicted tellurium resistance membrane protein TerC
VSHLFTPEGLIAFLTLTSLEIVLGIDNIIFIAILAGKLPPEQRDKARTLGILLAVVSRLALLFSITWVMRLTTPFFTIAGLAISGKDLILILGGLFLLFKATYEIHHKVASAQDTHADTPSRQVTLGFVLTQIVMIDVVFSLDSVITAVGMTPHIQIMVAAVLVSVALMLALSGMIVRFIERHPAIKILALSFLIMIGALLVAEGCHQKIGKGYVYFAMAFSIMVEVLQMWAYPTPPPVEIAPHASKPENAPA